MFFEFAQNLANFLLENLSLLSIAFFLALLAAFLWLIFYYYLSKKLTTSQVSLLKVFILGMLAALFAALLEKGVFSHLLPEKIIPLLLEQGRITFDLEKIFLVFLIAFLLTALPEEIIKFLFLKTIIFKSRSFDQIIDGIKFGILFGLGFGTIENIFFYFSQLSPNPFNIYSLLTLFLIRFLVPTLIHSIYGGIMGYFLALAKFYRIFQSSFLWKAFFLPFLIHGFFNYLLFTPFNLMVIFLLISTLLILLKWYRDRQHFQLMLSKKPQPLSPPILTEPREMQALIFKSLPKFYFLRKFGICLFCFKKLKLINGKCSYCNNPVNQSNLTS